MYVSKRIDSEVIKKVSKDLGFLEDIVSKIHKFQWKEAYKESKKCRSLEISGLCTLKVYPKYLEKEILKVEKNKNWIEKQVGKLRSTIKLNYLIDKLEYLKGKRK